MLFQGLGRSQRNLVKEAISSDEFEGKKGQRMVVWTPECRVMLIGMGEKDGLSHGMARNTGARVMASLSKKKGLSVCVRFTSGWTGERMIDFAEGMMLRDYEFLEHQEIDDDHIVDPWSVQFQASPRYQESLAEGLSRIQSIVGGVHLARDLGNEPANVLYPMEYARRAEEWAADKDNVTVEVYDWDKLQELGMGGLINVGKGSDRKPCMVLFTLNPDEDEGVQRPWHRRQRNNIRHGWNINQAYWWNVGYEVRYVRCCNSIRTDGGFTLDRLRPQSEWNLMFG